MQSLGLVKALINWMLESPGIVKIAATFGPFIPVSYTHLDGISPHFYCLVNANALDFRKLRDGGLKQRCV